jgi:hypothetical protein
MVFKVSQPCETMAWASLQYLCQFEQIFLIKIFDFGIVPYFRPKMFFLINGENIIIFALQRTFFILPIWPL